MPSVLQRELLVITGKGGVGKTTTAAMLGLLAARRGLRVIVAELGEQSRLPELFGTARDDSGAEIELVENLSTISIDPDRALMEWLQSIGGPVAGRMLSSSSTFQYFAAAAPGAKELVSMIKVWELTQGERWRRRATGYDLVILDAPATGHALGMLHSPWTFGSIARVGPIAGHTRELQQLLEDPARSGYVAVAHASEMAVSEVLAIQDGLGEKMKRELDTVIVNEVLPRRFTEPELRRIAALDGDGSVGRRGSDAALTHAAVAAARSAHERSRVQRNQLARLRRRKLPVVSVPFVFAAELDLEAMRRLAGRLATKL